MYNCYKDIHKIKRKKCNPLVWVNSTKNKIKWPNAHSCYFYDISFLIINFQYAYTYMYTLSTISLWIQNIVNIAPKNTEHFLIWGLDFPNSKIKSFPVKFKHVFKLLYNTHHIRTGLLSERGSLSLFTTNKGQYQIIT